MKLKIILLALILLTGAQYVSANTSANIALLTVSTAENASFGGIADLNLEIRPGTGRVFIDSFPLTQIDTQVSTRFAKEMACNYLDIDCSNLDFFYTIRATTTVVSGPSAGAAKTALTIGLLKGTSLNSDTVITGTINSGGLIGPVSGIEEKAIAARNAGYNKILVPTWSLEYEKENEVKTNDSLIIERRLKTDLVEGIEIIPVANLDEVMTHFTDNHFYTPLEHIQIPELYQEYMRNIADDLCNRTSRIMNLVDLTNRTHLIRNYDLGREAYTRNDYYSAASFCFSSATVLRNVYYSEFDNQTRLEVKENLTNLVEERLEHINSQNLRTMAQLETSIIVKERLFEAKSLLEEENVLENLGYIEERIESANFWFRFFDYPSRNVRLDDAHLRNACYTKIAEAEERANFLEFMFQTANPYASDLSRTREIANSRDYTFCLFRATRIKSDINNLLIGSSVPDTRFLELVEQRLRLSQNQIIKQEDFPILGYSYFNYAQSLKDSNPRSAFLFAEYSAEFSNLGMYFPRIRPEAQIQFQDMNQANFIVGFVLGITLAIILLSLSQAHHKRRKTKTVDKKPRKISKRNPPRKKR